MLNLPSFSGGLNPWGTPSNEKSSKVCYFCLNYTNKHTGAAWIYKVMLGPKVVRM